MSLTKEQLKNILATSDFDQLVGEVENDWFECKSQPYQLHDDKGKRELAKDVSSFANLDGGYIVVGLKTKTSTTHFGDEVESVRPFIQGLVNTAQYKDIIKDWIYPTISGLEVEWIATKSDPTKGLVIITIPEQDSSQKPFLIVKTLDGTKHVEIVFGYAERKSDSSEHLEIRDLQQALKSGFNYEKQVKERFDGLDALVRQSINTNLVAEEQANTQKKIDTRLTKAIQHGGLDKKRLLILTAYPSGPAELKTIFSSEDGSIRHQLERPPVLRHAGWSLETLDRARIKRGEMIEVTNGDRKIINLYRDGMMIFAAPADETFLAWGSGSEDSDQKQLIHSISIVELVYLFTKFYKLAIQDFRNIPETIIIMVNLKNLHLNGIKTAIDPRPVGNFISYAGMYGNKGEAPENEMLIKKEFSATDFDPGIVAHDLIKEVFLWFGLDEDVPYSRKGGELQFVDEEEIKKV